MDPVVAIILAPFVLTSIGVSVWGFFVLDPTVRFPTRVGGLAPSNGVPKVVGLALWPLTSVVVGLGTAVVASEPAAPAGPLLVMGIFGIAVVLFGQIYGINRVR